MPSRGMRIDCARLQEKYKIPLELVLDALSLGMNNEEVAAVTGLEVEEVKSLRQELGDIGSTLDIAHKRDICKDAFSEGKKE